MKHTLLCAAILGAIPAFAQFTQTNEPLINDTQPMYLCDSFATTYPNVTGSGVTWDYSALEGYNVSARDLTIGDATSSLHAADFPSSVKTIEVDNVLTTYMNSTTTERVSQGFVYNEPTFGEVIAKFSVDEETLMTYPFGLGDYVGDTYEGTLDFTFNGVPQTTAATGSAHAWVDGEGTLIMPDGSQHYNVLRYKVIDTSLTNVMLFGDLEIVRTQYEYYDIANNSLPLLTLSSVTIQQPGGGLPLTSQSIVLSSIQPSIFVGLNEATAIDFSVFPNPTKEVLSVQGTFGADAHYTLTDQGGRVIATGSLSSMTTIDLSKATSGMYMLRVTDNGTTATKTVVKQ